MIDNFAILASTLAVLFVMVRAVLLDRTLPWFERDEDATGRRDGNTNANWQSSNSHDTRRL